MVGPNTPELNMTGAYYLSKQSFWEGLQKAIHDLRHAIEQNKHASSWEDAKFLTNQLDVMREVYTVVNAKVEAMRPAYRVGDPYTFDAKKAQKLKEVIATFDQDAGAGKTYQQLLSDAQKAMQTWQAEHKDTAFAKALNADGYNNEYGPLFLCNMAVDTNLRVVQESKEQFAAHEAAQQQTRR